MYNYSVFTKLPPKLNFFDKGSPALLTCEMKAPYDSVIYWTLTQERSRECMIPMQDFNASALPNIQACNQIAYATLTQDMIDDTYALFRLELKVRDYILVL